MESYTKNLLTGVRFNFHHLVEILNFNGGHQSLSSIKGTSAAEFSLPYKMNILVSGKSFVVSRLGLGELCEQW